MKKYEQVLSSRCHVPLTQILPQKDILKGFGLFLP